MTKNTSILDLLPPRKAPELSPRLRRLLRTGNDGTYASDFDYEWAIALGAVNAGKSEEWLRKVLKDRGPFYASIEERGKEKAKRYVSKLYAKAVDYREQNPPWRSAQNASVALAEYAAWVQTLPNWRGKKGNRNLEVFLAVLDLAIQVGSNIVSFSTRQLAEHSSKSQKTVDRALKDLRAERWLVAIQEKRSITEAPTYKIPVASSPDHGRRLTNIFLPSRGVGSSESSTVPLIFDELGISAYRVWSLLDAEEGTEVKTLVKTTRLSESTIREALLRLDTIGAATKKDGAWYRVETDLEALAYERGLHVKRAAKAQQHAMQRAKWMHDLGLGDPLKYHKEHDLVGEARNAIVDEHSPALVSAQKPRGEDEEALHLSSDEVQSRSEIPNPGTPVREVGGAILPSGGPQPVPNHHEGRVPVLDVEVLGPPVDPPRARGGREEDLGAVKDDDSREAACLGCGQVQSFTAPDLRPYSCAYCGGKFEFVAVLSAA